MQNIYLTIALSILLTACGSNTLFSDLVSADSSGDNRETNSAATAETDSTDFTTDVRTSEEGVEFFLNLPDEMRQQEENAIELPYPLPPPPTESNKFRLRCEGAGGGHLEPGNQSLTIAKPLAKIVFKLSQSNGPDYQESMYYYCTGRAKVTILDIEFADSYQLSAEIYATSGELRYQGTTGQFSPAQDVEVKLVMKKAPQPEPEPVDVEVDITFEDQPTDDHEYCKVAFRCADIYKPAACKVGFIADARPQADSMVIALTASASNVCSAQADLYQKACNLVKIGYVHGQFDGEIDCVVADQAIDPPEETEEEAQEEATEEKAPGQ